MNKATSALAGALLVGIAAAGTAPTAHAKLNRITYTTATNVCQPATPLELGGLRFRPMGIYNNKPESIYISCSIDTEFVADDDLTDLTIVFNNQGTSSQTVECTAQGGSRYHGPANVSDSVLVTAGAVAQLSFSNLDRVNTSYTTINVSCLLPTKVEMGLIRLFEEDAGDDL